MNKILLWFTGLVMVAFVFTFPTRDRRGVVDRIRLQVGAKHLVSKKTLLEVAAEEREAARKSGRKIASDAGRFDPRSGTSPLDRQNRLNRSVTYYCNEDFNRQACAQWLNYCGESCRMLVRPDTWSSMTTVRKPAARTRTQAVAANKARRPTR
jgi:hypothetical protein